jgi:hypothetical protein
MIQLMNHNTSIVIVDVVTRSSMDLVPIRFRFLSQTTRLAHHFVIVLLDISIASLPAPRSVKVWVDQQVWYWLDSMPAWQQAPSGEGRG